MGRTQRRRGRRRLLPDQDTSLGVDAGFQQLVQWMKLNGWTQPLQLIPVDFAATGRGLKTLQNIASGDILVSIPNKLLMTVETASKSKFGWLFRRKTLLTQQVLAAHLVFEKHLSFCGESFWASYIFTLPEKVATPVFTSVTETSALPSELSIKVNSFKDNVMEVFKELSEVIFSNDKCPNCQKSVSEIFTFDSFFWSWFVINSRAVYICPEHNSDHNLSLSDINCLALAPYLDMFNHSNDAKVQAFVNESGGSYQIKTLEPYKKFSQVFIHYGDHSNVKLFLEYGFIMSNNIHDTLAVTFDDVYCIVSGPKNQEQKHISKLTYGFLKSHDLLSNLHLGADGISWTTKVLIYVLLFSEKIDPKNVLLKVYSNNFTDSEMKDISRVGSLLVEKKKTEVEESLHQMVEVRDKELVNVSDSFLMAINLYEEYLNVLSCCKTSLR